MKYQLAITKLRERISNQRGLLHDLTIELAARERYGEFPDVLDKLRDLEQVALVIQAQETTIRRLMEATK